MSPFDRLINHFDGEIFNIGADHYYSINEVAKIVQQISAKYGFETHIEHKEPRHEVKHAYCNHDKAARLLNFKDNTQPHELIEEMFVWAMNQPERAVKLMPYEVTKAFMSIGRLTDQTEEA